MTSPIRILTVCTGNIWRSPAAQALLRWRLAEVADVSSAGTHAVVGHPMMPRYIERTQEMGIPDYAHVARLLKPAHITDTDLILTAETFHRSYAVEMHPAALRKAFTLREFAALSEQGGPFNPAQEAIGDYLRRLTTLRRSIAGTDIDIIDPQGHPDHTEMSFDQIDAATQSVTAVLRVEIYITRGHAALQQ